jgi:nucleotide-binding universal stress UspA family protein
MAHHRIVVGLDRSAPARDALAWAVREASRRHASVLVITAWPDADRVGPRENDQLVGARVRLQRMQREAIDAATEGLERRPIVVRELVIADPVTALSHAATPADLVVIGSDKPSGLGARSIAAAVAGRLARHRATGNAPPLVVVATRQPPLQAAFPVDVIGSEAVPAA